MAVSNLTTSGISSFERYNNAKGAYATAKATPKFVAVSSADYIYSEDGISWTRSTAAVGEEVYINRDNNYEIFDNGAIRTSTDAVTWTGDTFSSTYYASYGMYRFFAYNGNTFSNLENGGNHSIVTSNAFSAELRPNSTSRSVAGNDRYVAYTGSSDSNGGRYYDFVNKTVSTFSANGGNQCFRMNYGDGFWHGCWGQKVYYKSGESPAGTWSSAGTYDYWVGVSSANNRWFIHASRFASSYSGFYVSTNGSSFTSRTKPFNYVYDTAYGNGVWVIVGNGGGVASSTDGVTWTLRATGSTGNFYSVTFG